MGQSLTVNLSPEMQQALNELTRQEGVTSDEFVESAVKQYIFLRRFRLLRERLSADAARQGIVTDQDVFDRVS